MQEENERSRFQFRAQSLLISNTLVFYDEHCHYFERHTRLLIRTPALIPTNASGDFFGCILLMFNRMRRARLQPLPPQAGAAKQEGAGGSSCRGARRSERAERHQTGWPDIPADGTSAARKKRKGAHPAFGCAPVLRKPRSVMRSGAACLYLRIFTDLTVPSLMMFLTMVIPLPGAAISRPSTV